MVTTTVCRRRAISVGFVATAGEVERVVTAAVAEAPAILPVIVATADFRA
jgi:hypothetical protein